MISSSSVNESGEPMSLTLEVILRKFKWIFELLCKVAWISLASLGDHPAPDCLGSRVNHRQDAK